MGRYSGWGKHNRLQLILPAAQVPEVLASLHDFCVAGHLGAKKTLEKVRSRFYWPGQQEVDKWCADCLVCNFKEVTWEEQSTFAAQLCSGVILAENRHGDHWTDRQCIE